MYAQQQLLIYLTTHVVLYSVQKKNTNKEEKKIFSVYICVSVHKSFCHMFKVEKFFLVFLVVALSTGHTQSIFIFHFFHSFSQTQWCTHTNEHHFALTTANCGTCKL